MPLVIRARLLQTPSPDHLEAVDDAVLTVGDDGVVSAVEAVDAVLEKIVRLASPPDILGIWVEGRRVVGG